MGTDESPAAECSACGAHRGREIGRDGYCPDCRGIKKFEESLLSGRSFRNCAASARSIFGYQPPRGHREYAQALAILAQGAALDDRQAALTRRIVAALPLHFTAGDTVAAVYDAAADALNTIYFDTVGAASPEPGRRRDHEHEYTLADRITLAHTLHHVGAIFSPTAGIGWCLSALIERDHVRVIHVPAR